MPEHRNGGSGILDLMTTKQARVRQIQQTLLVLVDEPAVFL